MSEITHQRPILGLMILLFLNLFLISVQVRSEQGELLLRSWGLVILTPPAMLFRAVYDGVGSVTNRYVNLIGVEERNRELENENFNLQLELHQLRGLRSLVKREARLRNAANLHDFKTLLAGIIWRSSPGYFHRVIINAGTGQGVHKDTAVVTGEGIVGRVFATTQLSSEVELLTDASAAAGGLLAESRLQGIVQGDGTGNLYLNFIPATEAIRIGEQVLTSGADQIYPKGLPIGTVVSSEIRQVYRRILLRPAADFSRLEEVAVIVENP